MLSDTYLYGQLVYDKGGKNIQWWKVFQWIMLEKLDTHMQEMKTDHFFMSYTKTYSKWIKDCA